MNYNITALQQLGYTGVSIGGNGVPEIPLPDLSNVRTNEPITHTIEQIEALAVQLHNWGLIRDKRNALLSASDWTAGDDVPEKIKEKARPYRQALRDITINFNSPEDVVFPVINF